ncbi:hypothetical protein EDB80DRAFT_269107 [Ilyonectria destructans]|nr:hypothetical protein EDB80DRAFT_269107 [Ilyonectria destructans]
MLRLPALRVVVFSLLVLKSAAQVDDPVYEYCRGDGSICAASNKLDDTCRARGNDAAYYKCICESGWVPTVQACKFCLMTLEGAGEDEDEANLSTCKEEGATVASMPSSIVSQQEQRNKTLDVPALTSSTDTGSIMESMTGSSAESTTDSIDMSYTTNSHKPITSTIDGGPAVTLPEMSAPTKTSGSNVSDPGISRLIAATCAVLLAVAIY